MLHYVCPPPPGCCPTRCPSGEDFPYHTHTLFHTQTSRKWGIRVPITITALVSFRHRLPKRLMTHALTTSKSFYLVPFYSITLCYVHLSPSSFCPPTLKLPRSGQIRSYQVKSSQVMLDEVASGQTTYTSTNLWFLLFFSLLHGRMARGDQAIPKVSPGSAMTYLSIPCGRATPRTALQPYAYALLPPSPFSPSN
jgi:hypothetical protein